MKNKFIALLLTVAVILTACTNNDTLEIQTDETVTEPKQTGQLENTFMITTAAPTGYEADLAAAYAQYAVPADTEMTYEFTEEDEELHRILRELDPAWKMFGGLTYDSLAYIDGYGEGIWVHFDQGVWDNDWFYHSLSDELPFDSINGLKAELDKYFIDFTVSDYLYPLKPAKGVTLSQESGVHDIYLTENEYMKEYYDFTADGKLKGIPIILELDGQLYRVAEVNGEPPISGIDIERTRVISRDEYVLQFAYNRPVPDDDRILAMRMVLRNSDDGWKYGYYIFNGMTDWDILDFEQVWCGKPLEEIYIEGGYDTADLADFDYSGLLEKTTAFPLGAGDFIDEEYKDFRELYQKAFAFNFCFRDHTPFPTAYGYEGARLMLPRNDYKNNYLQYYFTGYSAESFYDTLLEIFTEEETERWFSQFYGKHPEIYIYDGAVWSIFYDGSGGDISRVFDEYDFELTDDTFDIIRTSYYTTAEFDWDYEYYPERVDRYEKRTTHIIFVNTEKGWRCQQFDFVW